MVSVGASRKYWRFQSAIMLDFWVSFIIFKYIAICWIINVREYLCTYGEQG